MPSLHAIAEFLEWFNQHLHEIVVIAIAVPGILVGVHHLAEWLRDYFGRFGDKERYRVLATVVKDLMKETETETAKLRRLRVYKKQRRLILDPMPTIIPENDDDQREAQLDVYYSVPGRLGTQQVFDERVNRNVTKFVLDLSPDEEFKAHQTYSTLLAYTMIEKLDDILTPPGFVAKQPVGQESFVYEAHLPPRRRFVRSRGVGHPKRKDKPKIRVFHGKIDDQHELRYESYTRQGKNWFVWKWTSFLNKFRTRYHVTGGSADFRDTLGNHDWFRVTILKPPQKEDIHICWCMEGDPTSWEWCKHSVKEHGKI